MMDLCGFQPSSSVSCLLWLSVLGFTRGSCRRLRERLAGSVSEPDVRSAYAEVNQELEQTEAAALRVIFTACWQQPDDAFTIPLVRCATLRMLV